MVSRRQVLAVAGTGIGIGATGVAAERALLRGEVWEKWIRGRREGEAADLHVVIADTSIGEPYVAERFEDVDVFSGIENREPTVTDEIAETLQEQYDGLEYGLIVNTTDDEQEVREGGTVSRASFNDVQVFDEATAIAVGDRFRLL
ncbi:hypothetical protein RBH26_14240 [Natronolimnohabitans sp. A-GB9]|uniref:hypothetical protein n=1 Tax=Natronolimnohabitans sp. A-GB9 TaxID=3069757 RepID=UPI0027B71132|nr:hypothetical protein [Natronolimnohabitans sp. A-GB9]MDQ2051635.1 hypothetical protein [Natronolimnohabitans sp. A-GB9]